MTVEAIEEAIAELPADAKTRLAAWLVQQDLKEWDRQIDRDFSPGGRGTALLEEAETEIRQGRVRPLDDLLAQAKTRHKSRPKRRR